MTRRPNPTLSELARGPRTAPGECEAWLVARAVEEDRKRIDALERHWRWLQQCMEADDARIKRLESPPARATGEPEEIARLKRRNNQLDLELGAVRANLERQIADARRDTRREHERSVTWENRACEAEAERDALQQQLAESRAASSALAEYATHAGSCNWWKRPNGLCSCGFEIALATATPEESTDG